MLPIFDDQNRYGISFLRLMIYLLFTPFFLLIDPNLPVYNYYLAGFAFIYVVVLFVFPRISDILNTLIPLTLIIDLCLISLLVFFNEKYLLALSFLYIMPIIRFSFNTKPARALLGTIIVSSLYLSIGIINNSSLLLLIVQVVFFFITAFYTRHLVKFFQQSYFQQANQDTLTKIYNRRYFNHMLTRMVRDEIPFCLIILDLDNFKTLNDTKGHHHGDYVLKVIALIQKECTRSYDVVTRYGGDEFAIIMPRLTKSACKAIAERIRNSVLVSPKLLSYPNITISMGIASFPQDALVEEEILKKADEALYKAKSLGKNFVCVYQED